jgi:hypothetical protein
MAALWATTWETPVASAAASKWSVPSLRSRLVMAKKRSAFLGLSLPACATERAVISFTITSGRAAATASPTNIASSPSITMPSAPSCSSSPNLAALVVVALTWCPRVTNCGTSRRPITPVPPATNTRMASRPFTGTSSHHYDETARHPVTCQTTPRTSPWWAVIGLNAEETQIARPRPLRATGSPRQIRRYVGSTHAFELCPVNDRPAAQVVTLAASLAVSA